MLLSAAELTKCPLGSSERSAWQHGALSSRNSSSARGQSKNILEPQVTITTVMRSTERQSPERGRREGALLFTPGDQGGPLCGGDP